MSVNPVNGERGDQEQTNEKLSSHGCDLSEAPSIYLRCETNLKLLKSDWLLFINFGFNSAKGCWGLCGVEGTRREERETNVLAML